MSVYVRSHGLVVSPSTQPTQVCCPKSSEARPPASADAEIPFGRHHVETYAEREKWRQRLLAGR